MDKQNDSHFRLDTTFRATDCRNKRVMEWKPVKIKPEKDGRYLVYCEYSVGNWVGVCSVKDGKWDDSQVSHWMPLPKPPANGVG